MIFLSEQDGEPEQELKSQLLTVFEPFSEILAAYLVRVAFDSLSPSSVALCLYDGGDDTRRSSIVASVQRVFRCLFNADMFLDIVFLSAAQQHELYDFCAPFFTRLNGPRRS